MGTPSLVNGLRTFGIWTLLSSVTRCSCAIDIRNKTLYHSGHVDWAAVSGHGSSVTKQEEKLKPRVPCMLESPACCLRISPANLLPSYLPGPLSASLAPAVRSLFDFSLITLH
ncbi:hypothetical protein G0U57_014622 [Chelydra serpentina]|uniref:Secreted protein n=1 Tax=Chelydra serpentina TaxID=8475 RepID=A0A8T1T311_CHESE|nr:hypothetical protein G0U57_014622 [Chelydra serpentina]